MDSDLALPGAGRSQKTATVTKRNERQDVLPPAQPSGPGKPGAPFLPDAGIVSDQSTQATERSAQLEVGSSGLAALHRHLVIDLLAFI